MVNYLSSTSKIGRKNRIFEVHKIHHKSGAQQPNNRSSATPCGGTCGAGSLGAARHVTSSDVQAGSVGARSFSVVKTIESKGAVDQCLNKWEVTSGAD